MPSRGSRIRAAPPAAPAWIVGNPSAAVAFAAAVALALSSATAAARPPPRATGGGGKYAQRLGLAAAVGPVLLLLLLFPRARSAWSCRTRRGSDFLRSSAAAGPFHRPAQRSSSPAPRPSAAAAPRPAATTTAAATVVVALVVSGGAAQLHGGLPQVPEPCPALGDGPREASDGSVAQEDPCTEPVAGHAEDGAGRVLDGHGTQPEPQRRGGFAAVHHVGAHAHDEEGLAAAAQCRLQQPRQPSRGTARARPGSVARPPLPPTPLSSSLLPQWKKTAVSLRYLRHQRTQCSSCRGLVSIGRGP